MKCKKCESEKISLFRHHFANETIHVKLVCNNCFCNYYVDRLFYIDKCIGDYTKELSIEFFKKRRAFLKTPIKPKLLSAPKPDRIKIICTHCGRSLIKDPNNKLHDEIYCSKKCRNKTLNPFVKINRNPNKFKQKKKQKIAINPGFYDSWEWKRLRYEVLMKYGRKCMCCFATGVEIHVDHIKPISKYPALALDITNLQVLCRDCNQGKSNLREDDLRPRV